MPASLPDRTFPPVHRFAVTADAEPGALPRFAEMFAKRGLVPLSLSARRRGDALALEAELDAALLAPEVARHVARSLRAAVGVARVLHSPPAAAACGPASSPAP
jgi:acetolactate synthase small subunit